nr:hypothetical protein CFP56_16869 [Quercus suber]
MGLHSAPISSPPHDAGRAALARRSIDLCHLTIISITITITKLKSSWMESPSQRARRFPLGVNPAEDRFGPWAFGSCSFSPSRFWLLLGQHTDKERARMRTEPGARGVRSLASVCASRPVSFSSKTSFSIILAILVMPAPGFQGGTRIFTGPRRVSMFMHHVDQHSASALGTASRKSELAGPEPSRTTTTLPIPPAFLSSWICEFAKTISRLLAWDRYGAGGQHHVVYLTAQP